MVQSHLIKGQSPNYGDVTANLVEYGIARLHEARGTHVGQIVEPLAFLSVIKWFEAHDNTKLFAEMRLRAGDCHSRGYAFENAMVLYFLRWLGTPVFLNTILHFHPKFTPSWADEKAQIQVVARLGDEYIPVNIMGEAPQNPGLCIVHYAETIDDVINWIETLNPAPAFLISSNLFGPDVLFKIKLWSESTARIVIVMAQLKSYTYGNNTTLDAQTLSNALTSLHSGHWFKKLVRQLVWSLSLAH